MQSQDAKAQETGTPGQPSRGDGTTLTILVTLLVIGAVLILAFTNLGLLFVGAGSLLLFTNFGTIVVVLALVLGSMWLFYRSSLSFRRIIGLVSAVSLVWYLIVLGSCIYTATTFSN